MKKLPMVLGFLLGFCLFFTVSIVSASDWITIRTDDRTLFVTPGKWRITQWNPSSVAVINVSNPVYDGGRLVGYSAETREPWRFILQQSVASGWRNPGLFDQRQAAYFIPVDGSTHAVFFTHVKYGGQGNKTIVGVKGTCRSPRNGQTYTVAFER